MYVYSVHLQHNLYYCLFGLVIYTAHTHTLSSNIAQAGGWEEAATTTTKISRYEHNLHILSAILNENAAKRKTESESQIKT